MNYLSDDEFMTIQDNVRLLSIKGVDDISHYLFDSGIEEYNDFLNIANEFYDLNCHQTLIQRHIFRLIQSL